MDASTIPARRLRVASYNIRKCIGIDRRRDPRRTLGVIGGVGADIVALQEADRRLGRRRSALPAELIEAETGLAPATVSLNEVSLGWHGNAVLLRADAEVTAVDRIELPSLEPRGAVLVEARIEGQALRVVATHLGLMRRDRQRQLEAISRALSGLAPMATVILGDFNEWSDATGFEPIEAGFEVHSPGHSFHSRRPMAALDRIATSPGLRLEEAGVHERGAAPRASDHLPVWADLSLEGAAAPAAAQISRVSTSAA